MKPSIDPTRLTDVQRLTHVHTKEIIEGLFDGPWITLYRIVRGELSASGQYSALVSKKVLPKVLKQPSWDLAIGHGRPGYSILSGKTVRYERFSSKGIEPLVIIRDFDGVKPDSIELIEELRHFHDLYEEPQSGRFVKIDNGGDEELVAEIRNDFVRVRKPPLNEFLAAKQMHLAMFFEFDEYLQCGSNPVPEANREEAISSRDRVWHRHMGDMGVKIFSRLMGKRLLPPPRRPKADEVFTFWSGTKKHEDFIIGYDEAGEPRLHNSDPDQLENYFGANPGAPHYLTPVHFRRDVLDKYYADSDRFSVSDGYLRRKGLWGMRIDNDHPDHVVVFLGDLGRDLPHKEQLHWKSHNTPPEGGMSETAFRRSFLGQFVNASRPDHLFKAKYNDFSNAWRQTFGWSLFRPLRKEDAHVFEGIHIPSGNSPTEFENQIMGLAKLVVDSLNDKELANALGGSLKDEKSIAKFERFLRGRSYSHVDRDTRLLRALQTLRSKAAAHRKGEDYNRLLQDLGIHTNKPPQIVERLLASLSQMLDDLDAHFLPV